MPRNNRQKERLLEKAHPSVALTDAERMGACTLTRPKDEGEWNRMLELARQRIRNGGMTDAQVEEARRTVKPLELDMPEFFVVR